MNDELIDTSKEVVALYYDGTTAPKVTAKGKGHIADEILKIAKENDVPIKEQPDLVHFLSKVELGDNIPEALYLAAAEVIAFAYNLKNKTPPGYES